MRQALEPKAFIHGNYGRVVPVSSIVGSYSLSNTKHTIRDIHDILKSYYKVARKRFVDDVCKQAAAYHLVTGRDTPIGIFSPAFVTDLSTGELERIAGEGPTSRRRRIELQREIENLELGKQVLV